MKSQNVESRLDTLVRLLGLFFLIFGVITSYYTSTTPLIPQLAPVFYLVSFLSIVAGLVALVSKLG